MRYILPYDPTPYVQMPWLNSASYVPKPRQTCRKARHVEPESRPEARIGLPEIVRRIADPADDEKTVETGRRCANAGRGGFQQGAGRIQMAVGIGGRIENRSIGGSTREAGGVIEDFSDVAVQVQGIGPDQAPVAPHFPRIPRQAACEALAMGDPAEYEQLASHRPAAARYVERGHPAQPRAVEQDSFLRQPFHPRIVSHS